MRGFELVSAGFLLVALGIALIFAGVFLESLKGTDPEGAEVRGGGVVLIGPIPVVFGTDGDAAKTAVLLTAALAIAAFLLFYRR